MAWTHLAGAATAFAEGEVYVPGCCDLDGLAKAIYWNIEHSVAVVTGI